MSTRTLSIRFSTQDADMLEREATARRMSTGAYVRMLVFSGRADSTVLEAVIRAVEADTDRRLHLRRVLTNPLEG